MKKTALILALCLLTALAGCGKETSPRETETGYLYTTVLKYSGEDDPKEYIEIAGRSGELLALLEEKAGAFVMNAYNFQDIDGEGTPLYEFNGMDLPVEIDPNGRCVSVDKNYLDLHGIKAADGTPAGDALVMDGLTQNILVPESFQDKEEDILRAYRARFYFEKVEAENSYNKDAGISDRLDITEDDLSVNIIYVKDGQSYPVYRDDIVSENGSVSDPVVQVYTGNIHCNYAHSDLSQWTYFYSDKESPEEAYEAIRPYVDQCGAGESLKSVEAVG